MRVKIYYILTLFFLTSCNRKPSDISFKIDPVDSQKVSKFQKVLILGNSITYHQPDLNLDWNGNWGMAASNKDSDYVHILIKHFQNYNPKILLKAINFSVFENEYLNYDLNRIDSLKQFKPDLLILRIGENVNVNNVETNDFYGHYIKLIEFFKQDNPSVKIICVSNFWRNPQVEDIIKESATTEKTAYVSLSHLDKIEYTAWGLFANTAVGSHPGDKGMKAIAELIWSKILEISN